MVSERRPEALFFAQCALTSFFFFVHSGDEVWRPGAMDEDPNKTTSSATDEWGAANETSEPTTFGATTTDADGTLSFIFINFDSRETCSSSFTDFYLYSRWLGIQQPRWRHMGTGNIGNTRGHDEQHVPVVARTLGSRCCS